MYEYIKGNLIEIDTQKAIVDVNGIGYKIFVPSSLISELTQLDQEIKLYTTLVIKEDSHNLYGFFTKLQKDLFELLITVSGIGAKTALLLLGYLDIENLHLAISNADIRLLSKIPGIGKKTAERLILELRDKLKMLDKHQTANFSLTKEKSVVSDAINALMNLGYSAIQAQKAVKNATQDKDQEFELSELITLALRNI